MDKFLLVTKDHFALEEVVTSDKDRYGKEFIQIDDIRHIYEVKGTEDNILCIEYNSHKGQGYLYESFNNRYELMSRIYELNRILNNMED